MDIRKLLLANLDQDSDLIKCQVLIQRRLDRPDVEQEIQFLQKVDTNEHNDQITYQVDQIKRQIKIAQTEAEKQRKFQIDEELAKHIQNQDLNLNRAKAQQDEQNDKIMLLKNTMPNLDWQTSKFLLEQNNYDLQKSIDFIQEQQKVKIVLINMATKHEESTVFNYCDEGMEILSYLNKKHPIQDQFYNLFVGEKPLTYSDLSNTIQKLNFCQGQKLFYKICQDPFF